MNMRLCTCAIANILKKLYAIIFIEISLVRNKVNSKRNTKWHFPIDSTIETQYFYSSQFDTRYCSTCNINNNTETFRYDMNYKKSTGST